MHVGNDGVAEMENLFKSYTMLHESFRAELAVSGRELARCAPAARVA
jgi:hypothetical protein